METCSCESKIVINDHCLIIMSAGSGKSHCGVADLLQHTHLSSFNGVIFRRTSPQLKGAGGIFQKASELYGLVVTKFLGIKKLNINSQEMKIKFPSGCSIQLRPMENVS